MKGSLLILSPVKLNLHHPHNNDIPDVTPFINSKKSESLKKLKLQKTCSLLESDCFGTVFPANQELTCFFPFHIHPQSMQTH